MKLTWIKTIGSPWPKKKPSSSLRGKWCQLPPQVCGALRPSLRASRNPLPCGWVPEGWGVGAQGVKRDANPGQCYWPHPSRGGRQQEHRGVGSGNARGIATTVVVRAVAAVLAVRARGSTTSCIVAGSTTHGQYCKERDKRECVSFEEQDAIRQEGGTHCHKCH